MANTCPLIFNMLELTINKKELYDEESETFIQLKEGEKVVQLEYSLLAISKWESKWKVPFFNRKLTSEEMEYFIHCMNMGAPININLLIVEDFEAILEYINDPYTATTVIADTSTRGSVITSEVIYASMAARQIPFTCETWNINRLFKVIEVYDASTKEPRKMSQSEIIEQNRALNAERRKKYKSKG